MYKVLFLLLLTTNIFAMDRENITRLQFEDIAIEESLKDKIPFLQIPYSNMNDTKLPEKNKYTLTFKPDSQGFERFSRLTGVSIFQAKFTISWYIFTNSTQIPTSTDKMLELVNVEKPHLLMPLIAINGKWEVMIELPNLTYKKGTYVYAYISYPNLEGVLVPLAGQSFYKKNTDDILISREESLGLNFNILSYWQRQGYL